MLYANNCNRRNPSVIDEAVAHSFSIADPAHANADECWAKLWDKPLYANVRSEQANRRKTILEPYLADNWQEVAADDGPYLMSKSGKGFRKDAYTVTGEIAKKLVDAGIARHRLYAIIGASRALKKRNRNPAPFSDLGGRQLYEIVPELQAELGFGWGHISVLHFLTDLGLAIKTDIHVVRTLAHLGYSTNTNKRGAPSAKDAYYLNQKARQLTEFVKGNTSGSSMREVDYLLMQMSQKELF